MAEKKEKQEALEELKKEYNSLAQKYGLPSFEEIDADFEISTIEDSRFLLRKIMGNIEEKLELFIKILTSVLQPEQNIADLSECRAFDDEQKKEIFDIYKKIMKFKRAMDSLCVSSTEKEEAECLSNFYAEWSSEKGLKPGLKRIVKKLEKSWESSIEIPEETGYMM